jgi:hypothetical protein
MRKLFLSFSVLLTFTFAAFSQKGIDTQTQKITEKTGIDKSTNVSNSINWGRDKTKVRERLANPYKLASRRDVLVQTIRTVLEEKKLIVDEASSKPNEGIIITQPFIFAKGPVTTKNELNRYANLPSSETIWRSGRYSLRIDVESLDGIQNNVTVMAKVEGKSENGFVSEWTSVPTSGAAEEEFLVKLVEMVTGKPVDEPVVKN